MIMQWGTVTGIGGSATFTATFPITFPTACLNVSLQPEINANNNVVGMLLKSKTASVANCYNADGDSGMSCEWIAIGY